jgi:hypothetical protein
MVLNSVFGQNICKATLMFDAFQLSAVYLACLLLAASATERFL